MTRIVYISRSPVLGFAALDRDLLRVSHDVIEVSYPGRPTLGFLRSMWAAAGEAESGYTYFASEHAVIAGLILRARRRKFVIAVGGYDTANDRLHRYGLAAQRRGWVPRLAIRLASGLLPHSEYAAAELASLSPRSMGKAKVAYLAIDATTWADPGVDRRQDQVVTVAKVTAESYARKGIDRFLALAALDPGRNYVLAGAVDAALLPRLEDCPPNLRITGALSHAELRTLLWSSDVYAQLSWHETFGAAVAEAMACGCVPLISDQPALIEVTSPHGIVIEGGDPERALAALDARAAEAVDRGVLRHHVEERFTTSARIASLEEALEINRESPPG